MARRNPVPPVIAWTALLLAWGQVLLTVPASGQAKHKKPSLQDQVLSAQPPLQTTLLARLDVAKLVPGSAVVTKVRTDWTSPTCKLRVGGVVSGHVIAVERRGGQKKGSSLTILFDHADCDGKPTPILLDLFAVVGDPVADDGGPADALTNRYVQNNAAGLYIAPDQTLRGLSPRAAHEKAPSVVGSGTVFGIGKVVLSVGTGEAGGSVLTAAKGNIRVETSAQLVLMPKPVAPTLAKAAITAPAVSVPTPAPVVAIAAKPEVDETTVCTGACETVSANPETHAAMASANISTSLLGYVPHDRREFARLDYASALTYLDPQNLLFTFDSHKLRERRPSGIHPESIRSMRAVLLDPTSMAVKSVRDWQVQGESQYIWPAGPGRILVHLGHQLRMLGPNLETIRSVSIPGQLLFVSVSPSGDRIAAGVLHERYTREIHKELEESLGEEPEEDIDVEVFDSNFTLLFTSRQSSAVAPPVLSDAGELRVSSAGKRHWRITEYRWDKTRRVIATPISDCRPTVTAPLQGSLFVVGCLSAHGWYRMLRLDGHPILQGRGSPQEMEESSSSANEKEFAVRIVHSAQARGRGNPFHKEDLREQEVSIYRAADGKRVFLTDAPVSLAEQSFALSPSGRQLAVLTPGGISLYSVSQ